MLKAGLMAREYGYRPTEILGARDLPTGTRFNLDFDIFAATSAYRREQQEQQRKKANPKSSQVGSRHERADMVNQKETLADQREQMEQAGMKAPTPDSQMSTLDELKRERAEARQMQSEAPGTAGETDG